VHRVQGMPTNSKPQFCKSMKTGYMLGSFRKKQRHPEGEPGNLRNSGKHSPDIPEDLRRPTNYELARDIVRIRRAC
jgi:hypothetical protein